MTDPTPNYNKDYPSIPSVAGSAQKNTQPIIDALRPYIEKSLNSHLTNSESSSSSSKGSIATSPSKQHGHGYGHGHGSGSEIRPKILELASGTGDHLAAYAIEWTGVDWVGSERCPTSSSSTSTSLENLCKTLPNNVLPPVQLDVLDETDWEEVRGRYGRNYDRAGGVVGVGDEGGSESTAEEKQEGGGFDGMIINNLLHCAPFPTTPSSIFRHASTLLKPGAWISLYGAFRGDDGGFGSEGDRMFHERFISLDPAFGLRTIPSIQRIAEENGWRLVERKGMMSGNWMVFFERSL